MNRFIEKMATSYTEAKDWEVNTSEYKSKKLENKNIEDEFLDKEHILKAFSREKRALAERVENLEKVAKIFGRKQPSEFDILQQQREQALNEFRGSLAQQEALIPKVETPKMTPKPPVTAKVQPAPMLPAKINTPAVIPTAASPKKFGKGKLAIIGAGLATAGLGAKVLHDRKKEKEREKTAFSDDLSHMQKLALYWGGNGEEVTEDKGNEID